MPTMKNPIPVFGVIGGVLGILISLCLGTRALWGGPIGGAIGAVIGAYLKERTRKMGHDVRHAQYGVSLPVPSRDGTEKAGVSTESASRRWWLAGSHGVELPFLQDHLISRLQSGRIAASALVCPEDVDAWRPICEWDEFAAFITPLPPWPRSTTQTMPDGLETTDRLPSRVKALV